MTMAGVWIYFIPLGLRPSSHSNWFLSRAGIQSHSNLLNCRSLFNNFFFLQFARFVRSIEVKSRVIRSWLFFFPVFQRKFQFIYVLFPLIFHNLLITVNQWPSHQQQSSAFYSSHSNLYSFRNKFLYKNCLCILFIGRILKPHGATYLTLMENVWSA